MIDAAFLLVGALLAFCGFGMIPAPHADRGWDEVWGACVVLVGILLICIAAEGMLP